MRCTINRFTEGVATVYGQPAVTYPALATNVKCRRMNAKGYETKADDKTVVVADYVFFFLAGQDITERDQITALTHNGVAVDTFTYKPIKVDAILGRKKEHHREVLVQVVR